MQRPGSRKRTSQRQKVSTPTHSWLNFTPLTLQPAFWIDASDSSTITVTSGRISEWRDKSGNARHLTQTDAARRPVVQAAHQNGMDTVLFDGTRMMTTTTAASVWTFLHDGTSYIIAGMIRVGTGAALSRNVTICGTSHLGAAVGTIGMRQIRLLTATRLTNSVYNNTSTQVASTSSTLSTGFVENEYWNYAFFMQPNEAVADRIKLAWRWSDLGNVNDTAVTGGSPVSTAPNNSFCVGAAINDTNPAWNQLIGYIGEMIIVSGANATVENRALLLEYLRRKWMVYPA